VRGPRQLLDPLGGLELTLRGADRRPGLARHLIGGGSEPALAPRLACFDPVGQQRRGRFREPGDRHEFLPQVERFAQRDRVRIQVADQHL
jgi:hypothetical protein